MGKAPVDTFKLRIDRVDVMTESEDIWSPEIIKEMTDTGFSLKGGVYVMLSLSHATNKELSLSGYVPVARRTKPMEREPENFHEAGLPEFMDYCSFHTWSGGTEEWGASMVNSLIAANYGKMPEEWLVSGMSNLSTPEMSH